MYKIGDKVEYCGEVVKITQIFDSGGCMVSNGILEAHAHLSDLDKHKSAHEKLIEMGYEFIKGNNCVFYRHDELPRVTIYSDKTYSCSDANLELSRILTQYLEELE